MTRVILHIRSSFFILLFISFFTLALFPASEAQSSSADREEVLGTFRYQAVGHVYVTMLYDYQLDRVYLPVAELFHLLMINMEISRGDFAINGFFIQPNQRYSILFGDRMIAFDGSSRPQFKQFPAEHFVIGENDYFLSPELFAEVFGLEFTPDIYTLTLSLNTRHTLPVVEHEQRARARARLESREFGRTFYPLEYPVTRPIFRPGFLDYNISMSGNFDNQDYRYDFDLGAIVLGGAFRTSFNGAPIDGKFTGGFSRFHWQYGITDNRYISSIELGEMSSGGLKSRPIKGVHVTNQPLEARYFFGTIRNDGRTEPEALVELYLNNNLVQFTRADASGYYYFDIPLSYGQNRTEVVIYKQDGRVERSSRIMRTPFQFQPQGALVYRATAGYQDTGIDLRGRDRFYLGSAELSYGLTNWLTTRIGTNWDEDSWENPFIYSGLSARVFSQYLVDADIVPNSYYQTAFSVIFPRGINLAARYKYYDGASSFNTRGLVDESSLSVAFPFYVVGLRFQGRRLNFGDFADNDLSADVTGRIGSVNLNLSYITRLSQLTEGGTEFRNSIIRTTASYGVRRGSIFPDFMSGTSFRLNTTYDPQIGSFRDIETQISRRILRDGNLQLGMSHFVPTSTTIYRFGVNLNLNNQTRVSTSVDKRRDRFNSRSSIRGSLGFDSNHRVVQATSRTQVGRGAASVLLFIDKNNSGTFDEGDEILPYNAVRISGSGAASVGKDGVTRITQLQSYNRYDMEILERNIPNPSLRPERNAFSFVVDPNSYKPIEIPFYMTGVIEGNVSLLFDGRRRGQGGLRLEIIGQTNNFRETVRTFNNGDFFAMNIPPGHYRLEVSSAQLDLLGVVLAADSYEFEIRALSEGDFVSGLSIELIAPPAEDPQILEDAVRKIDITREEMIDLRKILREETTIENELRQRQRNALRYFTKAQQQFANGNFSQALEHVDESLSIAESEYGIALRGSILFALGRTEEAEAEWTRASNVSNIIQIPDIRVLLELLIQELPEN